MKLFLILASLRAITSTVMDGLSDFTCDCKGTLRDFKNFTGLQRHTNTLCHKRRLVAAAEKAAKIGAVEVLCELCNTGHNYKSQQALNQHNKSALHKKRLNPELAAADEATKRAKQEVYREKQTAIKAGEKETARLAARDQSKANKAALQRLRSKALYEKQKAARVEKNNKDPVPWIIGDGTEKDVEDALVRYHGSTAWTSLGYCKKVLRIFHPS